MIRLLALACLLVAAVSGHDGWMGVLAPCPRRVEHSNNTTFPVMIGSPEGCKRHQCHYFVGIERDERDSNLVHFTLEGNAAGWVAVGFSSTRSMNSADVFGCTRSLTGQIAILDTWNSNTMKVNILNEPQNDMCYYSAVYNDGRLTCKFSRSVRGSSDDFDLDLNDYYYLLLGTGDTPAHNIHSEGFSYHQKTPMISHHRVNPVTGSIMHFAHKLPPLVLTEVQPDGNDELPQTGSKNCEHLSSSKTFRLSQRIPQNCVRSSCDFFVGISDDIKDGGVLHFTLEGKAKGWIAVGFSITPNMLGADVFGCIVYDSGAVAAIDTWNDNLTKTNTLDNNQNDVCQGVAQIQDGRIYCKFSRIVNGTSEGQDLNLNGQYYLLFGTGDTPQSNPLEAGGFTYHETTPTVSALKMNPVEDNDLTVELATIKDETTKCLKFTLRKDSEHRISLSLPEGCRDSSEECDLFVGIDTNSEDSGYLDFTVEGKTGGWVAAGFSRTPDMLSANVLGCNVYSDGSILAINTWNPATTKTNVLAYTQNSICQHSAQFKDGIISCRFSRIIKGSSNGQELNLNSSYYILLGSGDTPQESETGGFTYHDKTPTITAAQINPSKDVYNKTTWVLKDAEVEKMDCSELVGNMSNYRLFQGFPKDCLPSNNECKYFVGFNTNTEDSTLLDITLMGKATGWIAVGFSKTPNMLNSDVLGCIKYSDGSTSAIDTWCPSPHKTNELDNNQNDINTRWAQEDDGQLCCFFSRQFNGTSHEQDLDLSDMHYLLFGFGKSSQKSKAGGFTFHEEVPTISSTRINVVKDSGTVQSLASLESFQDCPQFKSTSRFRISVGFPEGCELLRNNCDYFLGINTNSKNKSFLDFTLEGKANGWVAVGFSETPNMDTADVLGCNRYSNGTTLAIDTWNPYSPLINILDEPQNDICIASVTYRNGRIYCRFSRSLKGATPGRDLDLRGNYYLMFGTGDTPQTNSGGFTRHEKTPTLSKQMVNLVEDRKVDGSPVISTYAQTALIKAHGILMIIAWPIFASLSVYFSAFMKPVLCKKGEWFQLHRGLMLSSLALTLISFVLIFVANIDQPVPGLINVREPVPLAHFLLGVTVPSCQIVNAILSLCRCNPKSKYRWMYNLVHGKIIGYVTTIMALVNIAVGIYLFESGPSQVLTLFLFASSVGVVMFITMHITHNVLPKVIKSTKDEEPLISNEENMHISCKFVQHTYYRQQMGMLILVHSSLGLLNIAVCIFLAAK